MSKTVENLNLYLVNLNVLYRKLQNYHWNVTGTGFFTIHAKLEELYDNVNERIDEIAERILAVGGRPYGTLKKYLEVTTLEEAKDEDISTKDAIANLQKDFQTMLSICKDIKRAADEEEDFGSSALIDEDIANYEKTLWMFKAYLA